MNKKEFLYLQYNDLNWPHQAETGMNGFIHDFIIEEVVFARSSGMLKVLDIGFGVGSFIRRLIGNADGRTPLFIEGCEPSEKNYNHFKKIPLQLRTGVTLKTHLATFSDLHTDRLFDFITAVYVIPHIPFEELGATVEKIHALLDTDGRFVMVVVNEDYLKQQLDSDGSPYTLLHKEEFMYGGSIYFDFLHYTDLPGIGRILDYSRETDFYLRFFGDRGLRIVKKVDLVDSGYTCTAYVFQKD